MILWQPEQAKGMSAGRNFLESWERRPEVEMGVGACFLPDRHYDRMHGMSQSISLNDPAHFHSPDQFLRHMVLTIHVMPPEPGQAGEKLDLVLRSPGEKKKIGAKGYVGQESIRRHRECRGGALQLRYEP
jgi:hypothetical protein